MTGETMCGDGWMTSGDRGRIQIVLVDGLGHGPNAHDVAAAATRAVATSAIGSPVEALTTMHSSVRHTRGAAATVASFEPRASIVSIAGIGNVSAAIITPSVVRRAVSLGGILGHDVRTFREYRYPWVADALLVMHSDGLTTHWSLDHYPGLRQRSPALVAAVLYRDFQRGRDDVTVVVGKVAA
jgi:hypothetical protein